MLTYLNLLKYMKESSLLKLESSKSTFSYEGQTYSLQVGHDLESWKACDQRVGIPRIQISGNSI
jgi:hypothetical protein